MNTLIWVAIAVVAAVAGLVVGQLNGQRRRRSTFETYVKTALGVINDTVVNAAVDMAEARQKRHRTGRELP